MYNKAVHAAKNGVSPKGMAAHSMAAHSMAAHRMQLPCKFQYAIANCMNDSEATETAGSSGSSSSAE